MTKTNKKICAIAGLCENNIFELWVCFKMLNMIKWTKIGNLSFKIFQKLKIKLKTIPILTNLKKIAFSTHFTRSLGMQILLHIFWLDKFRLKFLIFRSTKKHESIILLISSTDGAVFQPTKLNIQNIKYQCLLALLFAFLFNNVISINKFALFPDIF